MALTPHALSLLAPHLFGARVLSFGYPDLLQTPEELRTLYGIDVSLTTRNGRGHKVRGLVAETVEVFKALGANSLECVDIVAHRGVERIVDLNEPYVFGSYDLVLDAGTLEHCANVGQALMNAAHAVRIGGRIFHSPPTTMMNHGFYNICPTLLLDFYEQNGWTIEHLSAFYCRAPFAEVELYGRTRTPLANNAALYFIACRGDGGNALKWPVQQKYLGG